MNTSNRFTEFIECGAVAVLDACELKRPPSTDNEVASLTALRINNMAAPLRLGVGILVRATDVAIRIRHGKRFAHLRAEQREAIVRKWSASSIPGRADLAKLLRSVTLVSFYDLAAAK